MRYLILSDIHGSLTALNAVLPYFEQFKCDYILLLGDILYHGPRNPLPEGYAPKEVAGRLNEYADKAGVKRIRVHDIRHSHASLLINKGQNILIVSQRLGHSDVTQTQNTYSHLMPNVQKQNINALDFEM